MMIGQEIDILRDNLSAEEMSSGSGAPQLDSRDNLLSRTIKPVARTILLAHCPPLTERHAVRMMYHISLWKHACLAKVHLSRRIDFSALYIKIKFNV
jgi:hypothetical protein